MNVRGLEDWLGRFFELRVESWGECDTDLLEFVDLLVAYVGVVDSSTSTDSSFSRRYLFTPTITSEPGGHNQRDTQSERG